MEETRLMGVFDMLIERLERVEDMVSKTSAKIAHPYVVFDQAKRWMKWLTQCGFACRYASAAELNGIPADILNRCFIAVNPTDGVDIFVVVRDCSDISFQSQRTFAEHLVKCGVHHPFLVLDRPLFLCNRVGPDVFIGWKEQYDDTWGIAMNHKDNEGCVIGTVVYTRRQQRVFGAMQLVCGYSTDELQSCDSEDDDNFNFSSIGLPDFPEKFMFRWFEENYWICTKFNLDNYQDKPDPGYVVHVPDDKFSGLDRLWGKLRPS